EDLLILALPRRRALPRVASPAVPFLLVLIPPPEHPPEPAPDWVHMGLLHRRPALFPRGLGGVAGLRIRAGLASGGDLLGAEEALVEVAQLRGYLILLEDLGEDAGTEFRGEQARRGIDRRRGETSRLAEGAVAAGRR